MDFDFKDMEMGSSGMDSFLEEALAPTKTKVASRRTKVASLSQLDPFIRVGSDTLVHRSTQDFWSLGKDKEGYFIERLVDSQVKEK